MFLALNHRQVQAVNYDVKVSRNIIFRILADFRKYLPGSILGTWCVNFTTIDIYIRTSKVLSMLTHDVLPCVRVHFWRIKLAQSHPCVK
jgi:hypothetical protein